MLKPHEIYRHPECQRVSREILRCGKRAIVYGPTGSGVSMFVQAHASVYWDTRSTKIISTDDATTTTELFDENPGIREGSYKYVLVDLAVAWTKSVAHIFFKKMPPQTTVVIVMPEFLHSTISSSSDSNVICLQRPCPNATYMFLAANMSFFRYFRPHETAAYDFVYRRCNGRLSRIMQKFVHDTDFVDHVDNVNPYDIHNLIEADTYFSIHPKFDFTNTGCLQMRALMCDIRSFCDMAPLATSSSCMDDIVGENGEEGTSFFDREDTFAPMRAYAWWYCLHSGSRSLS
jgi:hypothetical protein